MILRENGALCRFEWLRPPLCPTVVFGVLARTLKRVARKPVVRPRAAQIDGCLELCSGFAASLRAVSFETAASSFAFDPPHHRE